MSMSSDPMRRTSGSAVQLACRAESWDPVVKWVHWSTLLLIAAAFAAVWASESAPSREQHTMLVQLHRSLGITVLALTLFRLGWRWRARVPSLPAGLPEIQKAAARATEYLLYLLLLIQPVLGMIHTNARGDRVDFYFLVELPAIFGRNKLLAREALAVHGLVAELLLAIIALHASAALYHHYVRRDGVLRAMLPHRRR
jgi:cytochrome b561